MRPGQVSRRGRRNGSGGGGGGHSRPHHGGHSQHSHQHQHQHSSHQPRSASSLRNQIFDSNGPDTRVRGNAFQVHEKYQALAKDALSSGDRVLAENYLQHAEHYFRIIQAINEATAAEQRTRQPYLDANGQPQPQPQMQQPQPQQGQGGNGFYNSVNDMNGNAPAQTPLGTLRNPAAQGEGDGNELPEEEEVGGDMAPPSAAVAGARR
jgi:hypothetical protein